MTSLTNPQYWKSQSSGFTPRDVTGHVLGDVLQRFLPPDDSLSCVEVGAYPGDFLCYLTKQFGYRPTAIDFRDDTDDIRMLFEYNGVTGLEVINADFLQVNGLQFDIVASLGFIEHFTAYQEVIRLHSEMVMPEGYLVIAVPYLGGMQGLLRKVLLTQEAYTELHATHNLEIMNLSELTGAVERLGLKLLFADYTMGGTFWIHPDSPRIKGSMRWLARIVALLDRIVLRRLPSTFMYSPMILCVAKKP